MTGDLQEIPYVGPKTAAALEAAGVATSFQLCAKFLSFKGPATSSQAVCDAFYGWLAESSINAHRGAITLCVAEKVSLAFPASFSRDELTGAGGDAVEED